MPGSSSDRNLLLGLMAVQMGYVTVDQLYAGMQDWTRDKAKSLAQVLQDRGWLAEKRRIALEALVEVDDDPAQSLAALPGIASARARLSRIADPDVHASLDHLGPEPPLPAVDPLVTMDRPVDGEPVASPLRFMICGEVGEGGLGKVYRAYDNELDREVALKEIKEGKADSPRSRARFTREAKVTGRLEHPSIVPVYGFGRYPDGRLYYAMKLIGGESFDKVIRAHHATGTPTLRDLVGRLVDVANAIGYAHRQGILHRDLKPGNIQAGAFGETIVLDWGLAKPMAGADGDESAPAPLAADPKLTQAGHALGTLAYMSPEQAAGKIDELGPATDVYALGAILYEILTAFHPLGNTGLSFAQAVIEGKLLGPSAVRFGVDPALEALCLRAMSFAPADRHPTAEAFAAGLTTWLAEERTFVVRSLFGGALDAYGTLVFQVQERLANTPDTHQIRQDLLASALNTLDQMSRVFQTIESIARDDPRSTLARRDVALSLSKLGDMALRLGDAAGALGYHERSLAEAEGLAREDPHRVQNQINLMVCYAKRGEVMLGMGQGEEALRLLERAVAVIGRLEADGRLPPDQWELSSRLRLLVSECQSSPTFLRLVVSKTRMPSARVRMLQWLFRKRGQ